MRRSMMISAVLLTLGLIGVTALGAQHQMGGHGGQQEQTPGQPSMMSRGMMGMPMMCQMMGRLPTSTIGLGRNSVSSRNRVP